VRSLIRTSLRLQFPANREINREFCDFRAFGGDIGTKNPCAAAVSSKFPAEMNREIIFGNREIFRTNREISALEK
jgi:hypothetical protein